MKFSTSRQLSGAFLVMLALAAYSSGLSSEWVYDDVPLIANKPALDDLASLRLLASTEYGETFGELTYRPVGTLSLFIDSLVFERDPVFSHAFNLALHIALGLLFRQWVFLFFRREGIAWLAAALFLCHPLATEVVNCSGFRREILAGIGILLVLRLVAETLLASTERAAHWLCVASGAALLVALLAKETSIVVLALAPIALAISEPQGGAGFRNDPKFRKRVLKLLLAAFVCVAIWLVLYVAFAFPGKADRLPDSHGPWLGFLSFSHAFLLYARLWIAPIGLSTEHFFEPVTSFAKGGAWAGLAAFVTLASLSLLAFLTPREKGAWRIAGIGGLWCCIGFAPVFQIIPTPQLVAERYAYVPLMGVSLAAAALLDALREKLARCRVGAGRNPRVLLVVWGIAVGMILVFLIGATVHRNRDWSDDVTLTIRRYELWPEDDAYSRMVLGVMVGSQGDLVAARSYLTRAIALDPNLADTHDALGILAREEGNSEEAKVHHRRAAELRGQEARQPKRK